MPTYNAVVSDFDKNAYELIRENIYEFIKNEAKWISDSALILEIAPQIHSDVSSMLRKNSVKTLDINPQSWADYIWDITEKNEAMPDEYFDVVICTEVLEHTLQPFNAMNEIHRILKKWGKLLLTTPYNFRIHGPLPDCWRFTEYGLKALLKNFSEVNIQELGTEGRDLMPLHYTTVAIK